MGGLLGGCWSYPQSCKIVLLVLTAMWSIKAAGGLLSLSQYLCCGAAGGCWSYPQSCKIGLLDLTAMLSIGAAGGLLVLSPEL